MLDLENRKQYEELRIDIKKLGGKIVDMINEDRLPFVVISDHPMAAWLEGMKGAYKDKDEVYLHTFDCYLKLSFHILANKEVTNAAQGCCPKSRESAFPEDIPRTVRQV